MNLNFLSEQCVLPESFFRFLIEFMLAHKDFFCSMCFCVHFHNWSAFYIAAYALFQIVCKLV